MEKIYLDNSATTKIDEEILLKMYEFSKENYANLDSIHSFGLQTYNFLNNKKSIFEKIFKKPKGCFNYTSGGSEANMIAIKGVLDNFKKAHIITTVFEHPSVLNVIKSYSNIDVTYINPKLEKITYDDIKGGIRDDTVFISLTSCSSEIGIIYDIDDIAKSIKQDYPNILIHTDFVQALGHKKISLDYIDLLTISSHKIYGPKGIGAIYISDKVKLKNMYFGQNKNSGIVKRTLPNDLIFGFLLALEKIHKMDFKKVKDLLEYTKKGIKNIFSDALIIDNNSDNILAVCFKNFKSEIILNYLSSQKIYISVGSACSTGVSHSIKYLKLDKEYEEGLVRISFSKYNTKEQIDYLLTKLLDLKAIFKV